MTGNNDLQQSQATDLRYRQRMFSGFAKFLFWNAVIILVVLAYLAAAHS